MKLNDTYETTVRKLDCSEPAFDFLYDPGQARANHDQQGRSPAERDPDGAIRRPNRPRGTTGRLNRRLLLMAATLVALIALAFGGTQLWNYHQSYESTDDAQIDAPITSISSRINGTISGLYVEDYQPVKAGQLLVQLDPRGYDEQARAQVAQAEAEVNSGRQ
jgi:hypothetical protein